MLKASIADVSSDSKVVNVNLELDKEYILQKVNEYLDAILSDLESTKLKEVVTVKVYEYLKYLLSEIPKHMDESDLSFVDNLLPWSELLPGSCK